MKDSCISTLAQWILTAFPLLPNAAAPTMLPVADWDVLADSAEENAVAPLLYAALKKLQCLDLAPNPVAERLRIEYLRADTANWIALRELRELVSAFARAQIPALVLKGGALATTLYPDPALRPMSDLDLLVPRVHFAAADTLLRSLSFEPPLELHADFAPRLTNYRAYARRGKNPAHVELHWHLFKSPYYWHRVPMAWFWERAAEVEIQNQSVRVFTGEAQLVHLAAHFALHHRAERLLWSYDLARLIARERDALNWDMLLDAVERFGLVPAVRAALMQVEESWGVRPPDAAAARLNGARSQWRDRAAYALMTAPRGEARFLLDAFSLPGVQAEAQFVWYHLFPSRAYLRKRYPARETQSTAWLYLWRFADGILKFFRSLGSMASDQTQ